MCSPPLAFWPFASAGMLFFAAAAIAPVLIHLWSRRQRQEAEWAAMDYLLAALRRNARRIRWEQALLLLIRVLIPILLAAALADPLLSLAPSPPGAGAGAAPTHWMLVLDGSYSMAYRTGRSSRFDRARELASRLVGRCAEGDGFTLLLMADPPQSVIGRVAFDPADVIREIDNLQCSDGGASLNASLAEIEAVLQKADEQHPRLKRRRVCFFTDLGRTTWGDVDAPPCRQRLARLAKKATLMLADVGQPGAGNVAVAEFGVAGGLVAAGRSVRMEAAVRNDGPAAEAARRLRIFVDGRLADEEPIDWDSRGRAAVTFLYRFSAPGEHRVEARLDSDPLDLDNHRWLSVPVRPSIRVLCIEGRRGAARYAALALAPSRRERPWIGSEIRSEDALLDSDLNRYDVVLLCNVARFSREEAGALWNYLDAGGGLIVFLGDQVDSENYNAELGGGDSGRRVLPARLLGEAPTGVYRLDPLDYRHEIVAPFRGYEQAGLLDTPVWKYVRLSPSKEAGVRTALAFSNGDPAILEAPVLHGRTILAATAASPLSADRSTDPPTPWTAWASWPSFVPLMQEMLALAAGDRLRGRNVLVGQRLEGAAPESAAGLSVTITRPDGEFAERPARVRGDRSRWVYDRTDRSGIYEARYGESGERAELYAVNVNTRESDLARVDRRRLPATIRLDFPPSPPAAGAMVSAARPQLFRWLLGLVLILLVVETLLAWRFGAAA